MTTSTHPVARAVVDAAQAAHDRGPARSEVDRMRSAIEAALRELLPGLYAAPDGDGDLTIWRGPDAWSQALLHRHHAPELFDVLAPLLPESPEGER